MYNNLEYKNRLAVGLIITFALLFFCTKFYIEYNAILKQNLNIENELNGTIVEEDKEDTDERVIDPAKPMIALTFDDGPDFYTMKLLEQLEAYDSRATFFMVGSNVKRYPETVKKMNEIGCELGNHTMNHARLAKLLPEEVMQQIQGTNQEVSSILGMETSLFRPPYGVVNEVIQSSASAPFIMWSVDTLDWEKKNAELVCEYVLNNVKDGDIVLFHDIYETTIQAVNMAIPKLIEDGYQLVTVSEMAKARGVDLENGVMYYSFYK